MMDYANLKKADNSAKCLNCKYFKLKVMMINANGICTCEDNDVEYTFLSNVCDRFERKEADDGRNV